ncbi:unnamed protein product, partial [Laminaria digitata]
RSQRGSLPSGFGYSALSDATEDEEVVQNAGSDGDLTDSDSEPVVITSDSRSISQAFWGAEQAKENDVGLDASTKLGTIARLENEIASLRGLVDSMEMD